MTDTALNPLRQPGGKRFRITLIDGPNMSNLGRRSKRIYGNIASLEALHRYIGECAEGLGVELSTFNSNYEGAILEFIHESAETTDGYLINPAGLTEVSEATRYALEETRRPVIEVHFANYLATGAESGQGRGLSGGPRVSKFSGTATGVMMGMRHYSYVAGLVALVLALDDEAFLAPTVE